jgi:hypothetical protein
VLAASTRPVALFGAWLAAMSGAWFVVGQTLSTLWTTGHVPAAGYPVGGTVSRAVEQVGFFTGLGVVIMFFAAMALGRFLVVGVRETTLAAKEAEQRSAAGQPPAEQPAAERLSPDPATTDDSPAGRQSIPGSPAAP